MPTCGRGVLRTINKQQHNAMNEENNLVIELPERVAERVYSLVSDDLRRASEDIATVPYGEIAPELDRLRDLVEAIDSFSFALLDKKEVQP